MNPLQILKEIGRLAEMNIMKEVFLTLHAPDKFACPIHIESTRLTFRI